MQCEAWSCRTATQRAQIRRCWSECRLANYRSAPGLAALLLDIRLHGDGHLQGASDAQLGSELFVRSRAAIHPPLRPSSRRSRSGPVMQAAAQSASPFTLPPSVHACTVVVWQRHSLSWSCAGTGSEGPGGEDGAPLAPGEEGPKKSTRGRKRRTEPVKVTLETGETALLSPKEYRSHRRQGCLVANLHAVSSISSTVPGVACFYAWAGGCRG